MATISVLMNILLIAMASTSTRSQSPMHSFPESKGKILLYPVGHCYNSLLLSMEKIASFLATKGYDVTMIVNDNYQGSKSGLDMSNVSLSKYPAPENIPTLCDMEDMISAANVSMLEITNVWMSSTQGFCEALLQSNIIEQLKSGKFDLAIFDRSDWCSAIIADALNIPFMTFASVNTAFNMDELVRDTHVPSIFNNSPWPMTFIDRMKTALTHLLVYSGRLPTLPFINDLKVKYNVKPHIHITDVYDGAVINLLNRDREIEYPRPLYGHEIEIGFLFSEISSASISQDILDFIGDDYVVLVSFGSHVSQLSPKMNEILLNTFSQLSHVKFIWRAKVLNHMLPNVLNIEWIPQSALVASGKVNLLVTHGGVASTMEAVYNGVPMLVLPMQAEQHSQASKLQNYVGVADTLDIHELTEEVFAREVLKAIASNTQQRIQVTRLSKSIHNRPIKTSEIFEHWIKRTIQNGGNLNPKRPLSKNVFQWFLLDMLLLTLLILVATLSCCIRFIKVKS